MLSRACAKAINTRQIFPQLNRDEYDQLLKQDVTKQLVDLLTELPDICRQHYDSYNIYKVVDAVCKVLFAANNFMEVLKPWELKKNPNETVKLETVLHITLESLRVCGIILQPVIPELSQTILDKLSVDVRKRTWDDAKHLLNENRTNAVDVNLGNGSANIFRRLK